MLLPYRVNTLYHRNPWGNILLIVLNIAAFVLMATETLPEEVVDAMVLSDWSVTGLLGYQFLHGGVLHLVGNMLFLFVFGNAVCGVMGSFEYLAAYLIFGVVAGMAHLLMDGSPAVGASGALSGIIGLYIAIYPRNEVSCFWFFFLRGGSCDLSGWILVAFWFICDLVGAFGDAAGIAYWAHIGGTVVGVLAGMLLLKLNRIDLAEYDRPTLLGLMQGERE